MKNWFLNASNLSKSLVIATGTLLVVAAVAIPSVLLTTLALSESKTSSTSTPNSGKSKPPVSVSATPSASNSPSAVASESPVVQKSDQTQKSPNANQAAPQSPAEQAPAVIPPGAPTSITPVGGAWGGDNVHLEGGVTISFAAPLNTGSSAITDYEFGVSPDGGATWYFESVGPNPGSRTANWYISGIDAYTVSSQICVVRAVSAAGYSPNSSSISC